MAMQVESLGSSPNLSVRVKGDLGDLEVYSNQDVYDSNDDDDNRTCDKQKDSRIVSALPTIPAGLVKPSVNPVFGSVAVTHSENVQFGNNTYFNGPVTIKQIIQAKSGIDNASFNDTENENDLGGSSAAFPEKATNAPIEKLQILRWHKVTLSAICITVIGGIIAMILVVLKFEHQHTPLPDVNAGGTTDSTVRATVMVYCSQNFTVIIITIALFPLTILFLYWLLTRETAGNTRGTFKKNTVHENCVLKYCMICKGVDPLIIAPGHLRIVSRTDWLAQPVEGVLDKLILPAPWVIISHTATESCHTQSQCVLRVRLVQQFHIESRGWFDIGYNFLVGGDGSVYYGRGWDHEGAHTKYYNKYSIGIAFIGTFSSEAPTQQQVDACEKLIKLGVSLGKLAKDYKLLAHRQLMSTASPGDKVYNIIKEWPHFVKNDTNIDNLLPANRKP